LHAFLSLNGNAVKTELHIVFVSMRSGDDLHCSAVLDVLQEAWYVEPAGTCALKTAPPK
jgi:hypothetical protein